MEKVVLAFSGDKILTRIREILESEGIASCLTCHSGAEVKRLVYNQQISAVICGYKLRDDTAESLFEDLPSSCRMLVIAIQDLIEMINSREILKLTAPAAKGELLSSVRLLFQEERPRSSGRTDREQAVIASAKRLLMERNGITEEQAHYYLRKESMDRGIKLVRAAEDILRR